MNNLRYVNVSDRCWKTFQTILSPIFLILFIPQFYLKFSFRVFIIMAKYLSLLAQFTVISFSCITFFHALFFHLFSFVQQNLSIPSSSSIKCFSVQFSTWSDLSDKLTSSICSCSHLFCSCLSSCFSLDCFLFRPAAKLSVILGLPLADILRISFTFVESLFSGSYVFLLVYSFILVSSTITVEVYVGNNFGGGDFIFTLTVDWLLRGLYIGNHFPSKVWRCSHIAQLPVLMLRNLISKSCCDLGDFNLFIEFLNFSSLLKQCFMNSCSLILYCSILFFFHGCSTSVTSSRILIIISLFLVLFLVPLKLFFFVVGFGLFLFVGGFLQLSVILSHSFILKEHSKLI